MNGYSDDGRSNGSSGSLIAAGIAIGAGFGVALGLALDNLALGIAIGAAVGTAIGAAMEGRSGRASLDEASSGRARAAVLIGTGLLVLLVVTGVAALWLTVR
jgi:hypothetical protein